MNLKEYRIRNLERTKKALEKSLTDDIILVNAFRAYNRICEAVERIERVLNEWLGWYFPTQKVQIKDIKEKKHQNESFELLKKTAETLNELTKKKEEIEKDIFSRFRKICPNTNTITGELIGLKLLEKTGSLKKLAECSASKIQVLGAEKALFRHITKGSKPPKYGLLFYHPKVEQSEKEFKGKMASILADKIAIAIKIDYFKGKFIGDKLNKTVEEFFNKNQNEKIQEKKLKLIQTKFIGVFGYSNKLFTKNLTDGKEREWNPETSKLAVAILKGIKAIGMGKGSNVLYLGASSGNTASYVSDIIGADGMIFAVEISPVSMREMINNCGTRENIAPILGDANKPEEYKELIVQTDVVYQDISQKNQVEIFNKNTQMFLKPEGTGILCVKARSIDSKRKAKEIFDEIEKELNKQYFIIDKINLEPYQKEHCMFVVKVKPRLR